MELRVALRKEVPKENMSYYSALYGENMNLAVKSPFSYYKVQIGV